MAQPTDGIEFDTPAVPPMPEWPRGFRLTKEQLAAAERTRDYHLRRLQSRLGAEHTEHTERTSEQRTDH